MISAIVAIAPPVSRMTSQTCRSRASRAREACPSRAAMASMRWSTVSADSRSWRPRTMRRNFSLCVRQARYATSSPLPMSQTPGTKNPATPMPRIARRFIGTPPSPGTRVRETNAALR